LAPNKLAQRFHETWERCTEGRSDPSPIWRALQYRYGEPHRYYHTLGHIAQCLSELDTARDLIEEFNATELAIWFHDVIYVYGAKDNEDLSAAAFREHANGYMGTGLVDRVDELIIATKHTGKAQDEGVAYMVDIDLSGFGLPWKGYLADSDALRLEAPEVTDENYYSGKLRFLGALQEWDSLFQTEHFRERLETTAQANIARYSEQLREQGFSARPAATGTARPEAETAGAG
jgi:predicted metal-dependent HD superfamily phosphohydrolase